MAASLSMITSSAPWRTMMPSGGPYRGPSASLSFCSLGGRADASSGCLTATAPLLQFSSSFSGMSWCVVHVHQPSAFTLRFTGKAPAAAPLFRRRSNSAPAAASSSASVPIPAEQQQQPPSSSRRNRIAGVEQDELVDPSFLADPDSRFSDLMGVQLHHKLYQSDGQSQSHSIAFPFVLLHGFGASLFSWHRVLKPLATLTSSKVLAFDRPAFGLTSRLHPSALPFNPYSMAFSVLATLHFIDSLSTDKPAVLFGHSAGSLVAVDAYLQAPERVAALILVAPAIIAPIASKKPPVKTSTKGANQTNGETVNAGMFGKLFTKLLNILATPAAYVARAILGMVKGMSDMVNSLYKKALSSILRSALGIMLIRLVIDKFGIAAVRNAWYDPNNVTEHVLDGYTKPLRTKGWDKALAEFTAAMLTSTESESKPPLSQRLHEISCPVLIITGENDRLVPSWNAKRLSQAIPGSFLEVFEHCGHLPHEEKVEEFVSAVDRFLKKSVYNLQVPSMQPVL